MISPAARSSTPPTFPFPYLYDFNLKAVLYYYPAANAGHSTSNPRTFYDFATGQVITKQPRRRGNGPAGAFLVGGSSDVRKGVRSYYRQPAAPDGSLSPTLAGHVRGIG